MLTCCGRVVITKTAPVPDLEGLGEIQGLSWSVLPWQEAHGCEPRPMDQGPERHGGPRPRPRSATPAHLTSDLRAEGGRLTSCHESRKCPPDRFPEPYCKQRWDAVSYARVLCAQAQACPARGVPRMLSISTTTSRISGSSNRVRRSWIRSDDYRFQLACFFVAN